MKRRVRAGPQVDWRGWIDDRMRGFPTGHGPLPAQQVAGRDWRPQDGIMSLPLLSMNFDTFDANTAIFMDYLADNGAIIAPHAKTPMSVPLARWLVDAGAWGASVADTRQASVMLEGGIIRLLLANQVGGRHGARRLASLLWHHPSAEVHVFVDSSEGLDALVEAWREGGQRGAGMPGLGVLVEIGIGRAGLRSNDAALALIDEICALPSDVGIRLTGIASYEGAAIVADPAETETRVDALLQRMIVLHEEVRRRIGPSGPLILSAGGSLWFDRVTALLGPVAQADGRTRLILRSGAAFFGDHGVYQRGFEAMAERGTNLAGKIGGSLRLWAEVLSLPEPGLAIVGMGMRDVAIDQDLPRPLSLWRDGITVGPADHLSVERLNDQHAFIQIGPGGAAPRIGDVVEFGLSHPCTNIDRHGVIWMLADDHEVIAALPTAFG